MDELKSFAWQIAAGLSVEELKRILKQDDLSQTRTSNDIVQQLSLAKIGTDDPALINQFVSPQSNRSLSSKSTGHQTNIPDLRFRSIVSITGRTFRKFTFNNGRLIVLSRLGGCNGLGFSYQKLGPLRVSFYVSNQIWDGNSAVNPVSISIRFRSHGAL